jgi:conjugative transposon TraJ protein
MKKYLAIAIFAVLGILFPALSHAQSGLAEDIGSLQSVLDNLYKEMLPMCGDLIGVGRGIAGFAATWYIAARVWRHIANAEPIDFYPLFRPFVLGFCIIFFPAVLAMINSIMQPTVTGTAIMVKNTDKAVAELLKEKEKKVKQSEAWKMYVGENEQGDIDRWYRYTHNNADFDDASMFGSIGAEMQFAMEKAYYKFRNSIKQWMSEILQVIFQAAALCINTLRTFQLIVLAILGPLVFGIAVFDGFQHTLTAWIAKYLNVFLWLPVANIFGAIIGKVQEHMLKLDLKQVQETGDTFFGSSDTGYLIFMLIGIVGYFTVPSVANSIVNAGGGGAMLQKITSLTSTSANNIGSSGMAASATAGGAIKNAGGYLLKGASSILKPSVDSGLKSPDQSYAGKPGGYMGNKISGNDK